MPVLRNPFMMSTALFFLTLAFLDLSLAWTTLPQQTTTRPPPRLNLRSNAAHYSAANIIHKPCSALRCVSASGQSSTTGNTVYEAGNRLGVLLLTIGCPDRTDAVGDFFFNMFSDPDVRLLPGPFSAFTPLVAKVTASLRQQDLLNDNEFSRCFSEECQLIGATFEQQASQLSQYLSSAGVDAVVRVGAQYVSPNIETALEAMKQEGVGRLVILPLYPQFSMRTSGAGLRRLERMFDADEQLGEWRNTVVPAWYKRDGFIAALADNVHEIVEAQGLNGRPSAHIVFTAMGLSTKYRQLGDPYEEQTKECVELVMRRLGSSGVQLDHTLTFQWSELDDKTHLSPYTNAVITRLADEGCEDVVLVPLSHIHEHMETILDLDIKTRALASKLGIRGWHRVRCLGTDPQLLGALRDCVLEALPSIDQEASSAINDGTPVSLRIVNDLVDLTRFGQTTALSPPEFNKRWGFTYTAEIVNGRIAMGAIFGLVFSKWPILAAGLLTQWGAFTAWENFRRTEGLDFLNQLITSVDLLN